MHRFASTLFILSALCSHSAHANKKNCDDILVNPNIDSPENHADHRQDSDATSKDAETIAENSAVTATKKKISPEKNAPEKNVSVDEKTAVNSNGQGEGKYAPKHKGTELSKDDPAIRHIVKEESSYYKSLYGYSSSYFIEAKERELEKIQKALDQAGQADLARHTADFVAAQWMGSLLKEYRSIALLYGNPMTRLSKSEIDLLVRFIKLRVAEHNLILYDADSQAGPVIAKYAGHHGIGITGRDLKNPSGAVQLLSVTNPYLRLKLFTQAKLVAISSNSIVGLGVALESPEKTETPFASKKENWENPARRLSEQGSGFSRISSFGYSWGSPEKWEGKPVQILWNALKTDPIISKLPSFDLSEIADSAKIMAEARQRMAFDRKNDRFIPGGVVIFGASSEIPPFTNLVYDTTRHLAQQGVPVITGGAGGFMKVANAAAFDAGAYSIGIPMGGRHALKSEKETASSVHTHTVGSYGYETRIPLLLDRRVLIGVAPGRMGTVREVATSFVHLGATREISQQIYFLASSYYGAFVKAIHDGAYPDALKRSVWIVDKPEDLEPILDKIENDPSIPKAVLRTETAPTPRNDNTSFKTTESGWSWE